MIFLRLFEVVFNLVCLLVPIRSGNLNSTVYERIIFKSRIIFISKIVKSLSLCNRNKHFKICICFEHLFWKHCYLRLYRNCVLTNKLAPLCQGTIQGHTRYQLQFF
jgi:hypothetical protein